MLTGIAASLAERCWDRVAQVGPAWLIVIAALGVAWVLALWATGTAAQKILSPTAPVRSLSTRLVVWDRGGDFLIAGSCLLVSLLLNSDSGATRLTAFFLFGGATAGLHLWAIRNGINAADILNPEVQLSSQDVRQRCRSRTFLGFVVAALLAGICLLLETPAVS